MDLFRREDSLRAEAAAINLASVLTLIAQGHTENKWGGG
jgi:hypothetical protein